MKRCIFGLEKLILRLAGGVSASSRSCIYSYLEKTVANQSKRIVFGILQIDFAAGCGGPYRWFSLWCCFVFRGTADPQAKRILLIFRRLRSSRIIHRRFNTSLPRAYLILQSLKHVG